MNTRSFATAIALTGIIGIANAQATSPDTSFDIVQPSPVIAPLHHSSGSPLKHLYLDAYGNSIDPPANIELASTMRYSNTITVEFEQIHADSLVLDDITMIPGGGTLSGLSFSCFNSGATTLNTIIANITFTRLDHTDTPPDLPAPVSLIVFIDFADLGGLLFDQGAIITLFDLEIFEIVLPETSDPPNSFWAGISWSDAVGAPLTHIGQVLATTADVGSSENRIYIDGFGSAWYGGDPLANFLWEFHTINDPAPCPADLTGDGALNFLDVSAFLAAFGAGDPIADFQPDGSFNFLDVSAFLAAFGAGCP